MTWIRFVLMMYFFMVAHKATCQTLPKLDNVAFLSYTSPFDFVCLTETYVASEFESNLFKDFGVFVAKAENSLTTEGIQGALQYL